MNLRDFRHTIAASYIGYITQAVVNNLAPVLFLIFRSDFGLTIGDLAFLSALNFAVQLTVDLLSAFITKIFGYRFCIVSAHFFSAAGLAGLALFPRILSDPFAGLIIAFVVYAIGGGLIEVLVSPLVESCPTKNKAAHMSLLHSFYCWGQVLVVSLSTLYLLAFGKDKWELLAYIWAILPFLNGFYFLFVPIITPDTENDEHRSLLSMLRTKGFLLFCLLMICSGACELAISQWASAFAEAGLHVSKAIGDLTGPCIFAFLMGSARVISSILTKKYPIRNLIFGSALLCLFSYLVISLSPYPAISLIGCGICGFSVGILWPGTYSMASARYPGAGTAMFALLALSGDLGCTLGPALVGTVSSSCGDNLSIGLLAAAVFPLIMSICLIFFKKRI